MVDGAKQTIYGAGSKHKINGNGKVQVTTQFITVDGTDSDKLTEVAWAIAWAIACAVMSLPGPSLVW